MRWKKIVLRLLMGLAALFLVLLLLVGTYTDRLIDPYVRSLLEVTKPYGHDITYRTIRVNLISQLIRVKEVHVFPDSLLPMDTLRMNITVDEIQLTGFDLYQMLFRKTLLIHDFLIRDPQVTLTLPHEHHTPVERVVTPKPKKEASPLLTRISLDQISIEGGLFFLIRQSDTLAQGGDIRLLARNISLQRNSQNEPVGYEYGDVILDLSSIVIAPASGMYDITLDTFSLRKRDSTLVMQGFRMIPKYDKKTFSHNMKYQSDRFDLSIREIRISRIGADRFRSGKPLSIGSVVVDHLEADIYRDKNVPRDPSFHPLFYNESFLRIPVPLVIDTVAITGSHIRYGELTPGHPKAGTIELEAFTMEILSLTNQRTYDSISPRILVAIKALIMGRGALDARLSLPLEGNMHHFSCSGSVGSMPLKPLNSMLEPSTGIRFNGGQVNRMTFAFTAGDDNSSGWMEFQYSNLDVELLKKQQGTRQGIVSALANLVALSNNPAPGKPVKIVAIGYERDKQKGIINYIWKTIQSGLVRTIVPTKKHQINRKQTGKYKKE